MNDVQSGGSLKRVQNLPKIFQQTAELFQNLRKWLTEHCWNQQNGVPQNWSFRFMPPAQQRPACQTPDISKTTPCSVFGAQKKQIQVLPRFFGGKCNDTSSKFIEIWKNTLKRSQVIYIYIVYMHRIPHWISVPSLPHSSTPPPRPPLGGWRPIQSQWSWRCLAGRSTPGPESLKWHRKHPENKR